MNNSVTIIDYIGLMGAIASIVGAIISYLQAKNSANEAKKAEQKVEEISDRYNINKLSSLLVQMKEIHREVIYLKRKFKEINELDIFKKFDNIFDNFTSIRLELPTSYSKVFEKIIACERILHKSISNNSVLEEDIIELEGFVYSIILIIKQELEKNKIF